MLEKAKMAETVLKQSNTKHNDKILGLTLNALEKLKKAFSYFYCLIIRYVQIKTKKAHNDTLSIFFVYII